jgi:hypothetical protein
MIGPEERRMLYFVAAHGPQEGYIVDAGSFLGASTFSLAAGAAAAGRAPKVVVAYDYFRAFDEYVMTWISKRVRPLARRESYLDIFLAQTAAYAEMIDVRPGDFLDPAFAAPVAILFVDIAKTPRLNGHVFREFFPQLAPGSFVVQQDYHDPWLASLKICMELVDDYLELVDPLVPYQSRVWRARERIPQGLLERCAPGASRSTKERRCSTR